MSQYFAYSPDDEDETDQPVDESDSGSELGDYDDQSPSGYDLGYGVFGLILYIGVIILAGCDRTQAEMPYPTPRTTGFSSSCPSFGSEPLANGWCPENLPGKELSDDSPKPERGSGRLL